jgi:hypothetical protein
VRVLKSTTFSINLFFRNFLKNVVDLNTLTPCPSPASGRGELNLRDARGEPRPDGTLKCNKKRGREEHCAKAVNENLFF